MTQNDRYGVSYPKEDIGMFERNVVTETEKNEEAS